MSGRPIEIVGGGLAGLSLGLALRRAGVEVTIFEAGAYPRHRVCGEFIAGLDAATLETLQLRPVLADALPQRSVLWHHRNAALHRHAMPQPAYGISRYTLDARLANAFVAAGGTLRQNTRVADVRPTAGRVIATGRRRSRAPWLGLKVHALGLALDSDLEVHLGAEAYVGLAGVEGNRVNVCGLFRRRSLREHNRGAGGSTAGATEELLFEYLESCGLTKLAARLRRADLDRSSFSAVAAMSFDVGVPRAQAFALGDACAMIPPFTGNGMAMAFQSAAVALDPLQRYARGEIDWHYAQAMTARALRHCFRVRLASAHLVHPFILRRSPQLALAFAARAGALPTRQVYSLLH